MQLWFVRTAISREISPTNETLKSDFHFLKPLKELNLISHLAKINAYKYVIKA